MSSDTGTDTGDTGCCEIQTRESRRDTPSHVVHDAHVPAERMLGGEHALADGALGLLAVQLHVVVEALSPAEHLPTDVTRNAAVVVGR